MMTLIVREPILSSCIWIKAIRIQIGKLGQFKFKKGYYAYVGSAFGPGGLNSRIKHHIESKKIIIGTIIGTLII